MPLHNILIILAGCSLVQFGTGENRIETEKWQSLIYTDGNRNCSEHIQTNVQEAMKNGGGMIPQKYLYKCLLDDYIKELSPMEDSEKRYNVSYAFAVNEIIDILAEGSIKISAQMYLSWNDARLKWDSSTKLGNWSWPSSFKLPANKLWVPTPEVLNCNSIDCAISVPNRTSVYLNSNGSANVHYKSQVEATCNVELIYFPFDQQTCRLYIGIINDVGKYKLVLNDKFLWTYYMNEHNEWIYTDFQLNTTEFTYHKFSMNASHPELKWLRSTFSVKDTDVIDVTITAIRSTTYYLTDLMIPLIILNIVAIASVAFPAGSSDRQDTLLAVILAYCFFQSIVASVVPHTREYLFIDSYLMWTMVLACVQLIVGCWLMVMKDTDTIVSIMGTDVPPLLVRQVVIRFPKQIRKYIRDNCFCKNQNTKKKDSDEKQQSSRLVAKSPVAKELDEPHEEIPNPKLENRENEAIANASDSNSDGRAKGCKEEANCIRIDSDPTISRETWDDVAFSINWFFGAVFVILNFLLFFTTMMPLLCKCFTNLFAKSYFTDLSTPTIEESLSDFGKLRINGK